MAAPRTIRLRERDGPPPPAAKVVDADYRVVRARNSTLMGRFGSVLLAVFWAAVLGFAVPQAWLFFQMIGAFYVALR